MSLQSVLLVAVSWAALAFAMASPAGPTTKVGLNPLGKPDDAILKPHVKTAKGPVTWFWPMIPNFVRLSQTSPSYSDSAAEFFLPAKNLITSPFLNTSSPLFELQGGRQLPNTPPLIVQSFLRNASRKSLPSLTWLLPKEAPSAFSVPRNAPVPSETPVENILPIESLIAYESSLISSPTGTRFLSINLPEDFNKQSEDGRYHPPSNWSAPQRYAPLFISPHIIETGIKGFQLIHRAFRRTVLPFVGRARDAKK